eukprot:6192857-Pleurochrysis_carterae.AAC.2
MGCTCTSSQVPTQFSIYVVSSPFLLLEGRRAARSTLEFAARTSMSQKQTSPCSASKRSPAQSNNRPAQCSCRMQWIK